MTNTSPYLGGLLAATYFGGFMFLLMGSYSLKFETETRTRETVDPMTKDQVVTRSMRYRVGI